MTCNGNRKPSQTIQRASTMLAVTLALLCAAPRAKAQAAPAPEKPPADSVETFHLNNVNEPHEVNEIISALRNMGDPNNRIFLLPSQNSIVMNASPNQLLLAQKLLKDLDRPRKSYRLTYTITESDDGKPVGIQHFAIMVVAGGRTTFKNGSKVPIVTGTSGSGASSKTDLTYIDTGLNIDASVDESVNGVRLRCKIERSSVAEERSVASADDPTIRQLVLEGTSILTPGQRTMLGSLDVPGSPRHIEVSVVLTVIP
jgi:type II secretory pathway component GspD/PulD (secretin)